MKKTIKTSAFSLAKGKELRGDDFYGVKTLLEEDLTIAIVCDGVGSAKKGGEAAQRVVHHLLENFKNRPKSWSIEKSLKTFIASINSILYKESIADYNRVEFITTLAIAIIQGNRLYGANVGDSRIYLLRDEKLTQLSIDHVMDEKGYENVLTNAIGLEEEVEIYYFENNLKKDDKLLLCSDGLYNTVDEDFLKKYIPFGATYLVKEASRSVDDDLNDDTTAVVVEILKESQMAKLKAQNLPIATNLKKGQVIDGYKLKKALNENTWLCEKRGLEYYLKFAPKEAMEDSTILDLFVKEAWNAKRLKAGFFPKAVIPKKRSYRYYVMEALDGITLKEYIKKKPLHIEDAINLAKMLLRMGQYLLKFDLVHGDIKLENIIVLEKNGKLKFKAIDFGSITQLYSLNNRAGTPSYLSPERLRGAFINESSEIFAIGVTLYESLTQKFPYGEIEPFSNPEFKLKKRPKELNPNIPEWLESVILRSIEKDPQQRYKHYSEMNYELENSDKVKPYFDKSKPLIERNPVLAYKIGFFIMLIVNFGLVTVLFLR